MVEGARTSVLPEVAETISFARGAPALELIPADELAECAHVAALEGGPRVFAYGSGAGHGPLREWIADRHGVEPRRVVLTIGGLLGFVLYTGEMLARRPGRVLVEGPTYDRPLKILAGEGVEVRVLPTDGDGLDPDALESELERTAEKPSFLYTIPTFQNPSGRTLPEERRRRIVEIGRERDLPILEDDPYGLVRYEGKAPPTLHALDGATGVTYTSSFSKTIAPGLRTGYFVLPADEAAGFEQRAVSTYISPPFLTQATISEFLARGRFESNLEHVKQGLRDRRDAMLGALSDTMPEGVTWNRPEGGYFIWLDLGPEGDSSALLARAEEVGVGVIPGVDFYPRDSGLGQAGVRLAFSYEPADRIVEGVARLAAVLRG
jgi:2-aminoadipate transaminase